MKTIIKSLLVLAFVAVPFLTLSTPAHAEISIGLGGGGGHHHHHHFHHDRR